MTTSTTALPSSTRARWRRASRANATVAISVPVRKPGCTIWPLPYKSLGELLDTYTRLKEIGISPYWCINHGPTTSMYYRDPDNNQVELLIDSFDDVRDGKAYMQSPAFAENPIGVPFEPDSFVTRFRAGTSAEEVVRLA